MQIDQCRLLEALQGKVQLHYHDSVGSTNDVAAQLDCAQPQLVVTQRQTRGRGRRGRSWLSEEWGVALSLALRLPRPAPGALAGLSPCAALIVCEALESLAPEARLCVKWPNDIYLNDAKLVGLLAESSLRAQSLDLVLGVGVNMAPPPDLSAQLQRPVAAWSAVSDAGAEQVIAAMSLALLQALPLSLQQGFAAFHSAWNARDWLAGAQVVVEEGGQIVEGQYRGLDEQARLLVQREGVVQHFTYGEVSVRRGSVS